MTSFRKNAVIVIFLSSLLVASVGCQTSSSGGSKNPFSLPYGMGKTASVPEAKKFEKTGPTTMADFMSLERDDRW